MHSRLYQSVLTRKPWVTQCTAYTNIFENTGLMGILMATPDPYKAEELVTTLCQYAFPAFTALCNTLTAVCMPFCACGVCAVTHSITFVHRPTRVQRASVLLSCL